MRRPRDKDDFERNDRILKVGSFEEEEFREYERKSKQLFERVCLIEECGAKFQTEHRHIFICDRCKMAEQFKFADRL